MEGIFLWSELVLVWEAVSGEDKKKEVTYLAKKKRELNIQQQKDKSDRGKGW